MSRSIGQVNRLLASLAPDVVVFDCRGRGQQIACASRLGARTVYVAAQPHILRRALRWRRLRSFDSIFPPPDPGRLGALRGRLGIGEAPYLLFAPGGGGYQHGGRPVPELFAEAAARTGRETRARCVVVLGPLYRGELRALEGVTLADALEPAEMIDLLNGAQLAVCGGGALLRQAVALAKPCLGVPAGGSDQAQCIRSLEREGLIEASPLDPDAIARRVARLLEAPGRRQELVEGARRSGRRNGLPEAVRRLEALAERASPGSSRV